MFDFCFLFQKIWVKKYLKNIKTFIQNPINVYQIITIYIHISDLRNVAMYKPNKPKKPKLKKYTH